MADLAGAVRDFAGEGARRRTTEMAGEGATRLGRGEAVEVAVAAPSAAGRRRWAGDVVLRPPGGGAADVARWRCSGRGRRSGKKEAAAAGWIWAAGAGSGLPGRGGARGRRRLAVEMRSVGATCSAGVGRILGFSGGRIRSGFGGVFK